MMTVGRDDNFQQAAARHLQDAQYLLTQHRWDNAVYLAGYVVECSFKVLVEVYVKNSAKQYGHNLAELQGKAMERLRLSELVKVITSDPYQRLAMRLCQLFGREFDRNMG